MSPDQYASMIARSLVARGLDPREATFVVQKNEKVVRRALVRNIPIATVSLALATGGSAAGGKTNDRSHVNGTGNGGLNGQSKAMAHDGGTFSKSHTKTKVRDGEVESRTKTMAHEPGSKPVKSTTTTGR